MFKFLSGTFFTIFLSCGALGSEAKNENLVVAVVSSDSERDIADLLLSDLAELDGISLVERNEIDRIRKELELRDWSLSAGIEESRFVGANVLVLIERPIPGEPVLLRVVSTHTGGVLGALEVVEKLAPDWFEKTAAWIAERCRPDRVTGAPVVVMKLKSASGSLVNEMLFSAKLAKELYFRPEIAVLERWRLRDAVFEKLLKDPNGEFATAQWMLEGKVFDQTEKIEVEIALREIGSESPVFVQKYDVDDENASYTKIADEISGILEISREVPAEVIDKKQEVSSQIERGKWAMKWEDYNQAIISFENAIALAPRKDSGFETYLAAAYFMRGSHWTVISQRNNNEDRFEKGILDLCAAFALLNNATVDPLDVSPLVYGLSVDMLVALARSLSAGAALDPSSIELRGHLADLRRYSRQVYRNLLAAENLDPRLRKRMIWTSWIPQNSSTHDFYSTALAGLISGGLWEESKEAAVDSLVEATERLEQMFGDSKALIFDTAVSSRSETDAWIARWPGGFDLPEDMEYWSERVKGEGGLIELIPALAAVKAATPWEGSPFSKNDPDALERAAKTLERVISDQMEELIERNDPSLVYAVASEISTAWEFSKSSRKYQGARESLESAFLVAKYKVLDSAESVDVSVFNSFNHAEMVSLADRSELKEEIMDSMRSLDRAERAALQRELNALESVLPPPPNSGPMPRFLGPPTFSTKNGPEEKIQRREKTGEFVRLERGFPFTRGFPEVKILGSGQEPSRWLFKNRSEEFNHPSVTHSLSFGDGRIWVVWAYDSRLIVEHFVLENLSSTLWHPPFMKSERYFSGNITFLDGRIYIYSNRTLWWTTTAEENWSVWRINPGNLPKMRMFDRKLFLVSSSSIQELEPENRSILVIASERLGIGNWDEPATSGLKFIEEPGLSPVTKFSPYSMEDAKDRRVFREMAERGELRTDLSGKAAFWMVYQERGPMISPKRYEFRKHGPAIKELPSMNYVLAAGADSQAVWLLYREEDDFFLGMVPWNKRETPKEFSIRVPEFPDTLLVTPEAVLIYNRDRLPTSVYLKEDLQ
ncbi:MAG: hypothetical protein AAGJ81_15165 [Verrucomicrobiota bacterium]